MRREISLGLIFSRSGDYVRLADASREGAFAALESVNADPRRGISLRPTERDPQGRAERYGPLCRDILTDTPARHVLGCITSWSRKEVIPALERHGGLLWYAAPYEGFEANEHVVYLHACPNQHIVPLLAYAVPRFGADAFLLGSNYIWGWEVNRVARDLVGDHGGRVLGERYLPIGDTDVARLIEEIRATRPSFVLNNLIGPSSYAFLKAYAALGRQDPRFRPETCPVLSCNLIEPEIAALEGAGEGHLVVGPYFAADAGAPASSFAAAAHAAILVLADLLEEAGTDDPATIGGRLASRSFATPLGAIRVDPRTQHAGLPVRIGAIRDAGFETLWQSDGIVAPDPYLSRYDPRTARQRPALRVVS